MSNTNSTTKRPSMGHITTHILGDRMHMILGARTKDLARAQKCVDDVTRRRGQVALRLASIDSSLGRLWLARDEARGRLDRLLELAAEERALASIGAAIDNGTAGRPPDGR